MDLSTNELSELYRDDEVTFARQFVCMKLLLERTGTIQPFSKGKIRERLTMFDKLFEESPTIQKMRAQYYEKGKVETSQSMLVETVQVRFPDLTDFAQRQVRLCNDPGVLKLLFHQILTAPDVKTARWLLESTPKQSLD